MQELRKLEKEIATHQDVLDQVRSELSSAKKVVDQWRKDKRELDLKDHEARLLEEEVNGSNATKIIAEVAAAKERTGASADEYFV